MAADQAYARALALDSGGLKFYLALYYGWRDLGDEARMAEMRRRISHLDPQLARRL